MSRLVSLSLHHNVSLPSPSFIQSLTNPEEGGPGSWVSGRSRKYFGLTDCDIVMLLVQLSPDVNCFGR